MLHWTSSHFSLQLSSGHSLSKNKQQQYLIWRVDSSAESSSCYKNQTFLSYWWLLWICQNDFIHNCQMRASFPKSPGSYYVNWDVFSQHYLHKISQPCLSYRIVTKGMGERNHGCCLKLLHKRQDINHIKNKQASI